MSGAASFVKDVVGGVVDVVKDVGSFIDDKVIQPIVQDPISAAATVVGAVYGAPLVAAQLGTSAAASAAIAAGAANTAAGLAQGESPEEAVKGGVVSGLTVGAGQSLFGGAPTDGFGAASDSVYQGASGTATAPVVPSALESAIGGSNIGGLGQTGTAGFGTALPPASELTAGLTAAGFAPGTAANLAGEIAAGVGATNLLGGATAFNPLIPSPSLSITDVLRGARLASGLLTPQQPQIPQQDIGNIPQGAVDYSQLLGLLAQRANATGLLGTRFQPQPINLASLLG